MTWQAVIALLVVALAALYAAWNLAPRNWQQRWRVLLGLRSPSAAATDDGCANCGQHDSRRSGKRG